MNSPRTPWDWRQRLVPVLIDLATLAGFIFFVPWLGAQIFAQSSSNHFFLILGFVLMLAGTIAIRQLPNYSLDESKGPPVLGTCLVFFLLIAYLLLYVHATDLGGSEKDNDGIAVILFFILLVPFLGVFCVPVNRAQPGTRKALVAESIALISVNYLTLIGAAVYGQFASLPPGKDPVYATGIWFLILFSVLYLVFLAFFGLPRIYILRATGDRLGLALYLAGVAIFLWDNVPPVD